MPNAVRKLPESHHNASYQDVLDAPDNMVAQIINGEVYLHARPSDLHAWASGILYLQLMQRFGLDESGDGLGDWVILIEPELHLGADVLVPDIGGWLAENYPRRRINPWFRVVPDWVCEVLSPTTRNKDLGKKRDIYARDGVPYLWVVDPVARKLQVSALADGKWHEVSTMANAETVSAPPFETMKIPLARLWKDTYL